MSRLFLVLAGGLAPDDSIAAETRARVDAALARRTEGDRFVFSGRYSLYDRAEHSTSEAETMRAYAVERGVLDSDIAIEDRSQDTIENLRNSAPMIREAAPDELIVVTSWYHLSRVAWLAERLLPDVPRSFVAVPTSSLPVETMLQETVALALADEILEHGMSLREAHAAKEGIVPYVASARARIEASIAGLERRFDAFGGGPA